MNEYQIIKPHGHWANITTSATVSIIWLDGKKYNIAESV